MDIGDTIEVTIAPHGKLPLYRMTITEIDEHGFHGPYRCNFGDSWEDFVKDPDDKNKKGIGLIRFTQIKKAEIVS